MSSNEHPDMSGNSCDAPFVCEKCGHQFTDDAKLSGSFFSGETILCSQECSVEYDYAIAERLTADNARLQSERDRMRELLQRWTDYFGSSNDEVVGALLRTSKAVIGEGE